MPVSRIAVPVVVALLIGLASSAEAQQTTAPAAGASSGSSKLPAAPPQVVGACSLKHNTGASTCSRDVPELTCKALAAETRATPTWSSGKPCP